MVGQERAQTVKRSPQTGGCVFQRKKAKSTSLLTAPGAEVDHCPSEAATSPEGTTACSRHPKHGTQINKTAVEMRHGAP